MTCENRIRDSTSAARQLEVNGTQTARGLSYLDMTKRSSSTGSAQEAPSAGEYDVYMKHLDKVYYA